MIAMDVQKRLKAAEGEFHLQLALDIPKGAFLTFYGPSGAGKTSILRILSGLLKPDEGTITVNGVTWFDAAQKIHLPPQERNIGYVFQDYALFPNMTVLKNLEFALKKGQQKRELRELIDVMALGDLQHRYPATLSGGQQQRVALARAVVQKPAILLLDEPMAALDTKIRRSLQTYLLRVHEEYGLTTILVSHDLGEIIRLSSAVVMLEHGKVLKTGAPMEVFLDQTLSGKFRFTGEIVSVQKQEVIYVVTVLVDNTVIKVVADPSEIQDLHPGDLVVVASKAFNPILYKVGHV